MPVPKYLVWCKRYRFYTDQGLGIQIAWHKANKYFGMKYWQEYEEKHNLNLDDFGAEMIATITVTAKVPVELEGDETVEDFKNRQADIYLHGTGENGEQNKIDIGGSTTIIIEG